MTTDYKTPQLVVSGNSHIGALTGAYHNRSEENIGVRLDFLPFWADRFSGSVTWSGDRNVYGETLVTAIADAVHASAANGIVLFIASGGHFRLGAIELPEPFYFHTPYDEDDAETWDRRYVPFDLMYKYMYCDHARGFELVGQLRAACSVPIYVPCMPPLAKSSDRILSFMPPTWREDAARAGVPPGRLRRNLWRTSAAALEQVCKDRGALFLPSPAITMSSGFADEAFIADAFHGNSRYGDALITQLAELGRTSATPANPSSEGDHAPSL